MNSKNSGEREEFLADYSWELWRTVHSRRIGGYDRLEFFPVSGLARLNDRVITLIKGEVDD